MAWLRRPTRPLRSTHPRGARCNGGRRRRPRPLLGLELLEDRCVLAPITPVSLPPPGTPLSDTPAGASTGPSISADGRFVAFRSQAVNLVAGLDQTFFSDNVYLHDRNTGSTSLVSHAPGQPNVPDSGEAPLISADGRFIAYVGGLNFDLLLYDRVTDTRTLVNHKAGDLDTPSDSFASLAGISSNGRFVVFISNATDLVPGQVDDPVTDDIFLFDRASGQIALVTHAAGSPNVAAGGGIGSIGLGEVAISEDGQWVTFASDATNLVPGQVEDPSFVNLDVFLYEVATGANTLVSRRAGTTATASDGSSDQVVISGDGQFVAYVSDAGNLVRQSFTSTDVPRTISDLSTVTSTIEVSFDYFTVFDVDVTLDIDHTFDADLDVFLISPTGTRVELFTDVGGAGQDFQGTTLDDEASLSIASGMAPFSGRFHPEGSLAALDGEVAGGTWTLEITDDLSGDTGTLNGWSLSLVTSWFFDNQIYLFDRFTGENVLASHTPSSVTSPGDDDSGILFEVHNDEAGFGFLTRGLDVSDNGQVVFRSLATNLVSGQSQQPGSANDVNLFVYDPGDQSVRLVTHAVGSSSQATGGTLVLAEGFATIESDLAISGDGGFITYASKAPNLVSGQGAPAGLANVFRYNVSSGTSTLVSPEGGSGSTTADGPSRRPVISRDGSVIAFQTLAADLNPSLNDRNGVPDIVAFGPGGATVLTRAAERVRGEGYSWVSGSSADDRFVVFTSSATTLIPGQVTTNRDQNVYLFDKQTGTTRLVNHILGNPLTTANAGIGAFFSGSTPPPEELRPAISADGKWVAFVSQATNLVPGQTGTPNFSSGVFLYEVATGTVTRVTNTSFDDFVISDHPVINADGRFIAFVSDAEALIPGLRPESDFNRNLYLYDRVTGSTTLVSHAAGSASTKGNGESLNPAISDDGRFIAFESAATNLVSGQNDTNDGKDVFLFDRQTGQVRLVSRSAGSANTAADGTSSNPVISFDGRWVAFVSLGTNLVPGQQDSNGGHDVFLFSVQSGSNRLVSGAGGSSTRTANAPSSVESGFFFEGDNFFEGDVPVDPAISGDGRYVTFQSRATNLAPGQVDDNGVNDVFLFDRDANNGVIPPPPPRPDVLGVVDATGAFNPAALVWYIGEDPEPFPYGLPGWISRFGDWNGDGVDTVAVVDPMAPAGLTWYLRNSNAPGAPDIEPFAYGANTWTPIVGDWNGDGRDTVGVVDTTNPFALVWYLRNSNEAGAPDFTPFLFGVPGWVPLVGDWNGDGVDTPGVYDPNSGTWFLRNTNDIDDPTLITFAYGAAGWLPAVGDWDGDGIDTIAVVDPAGNWYLRNSNSSGGPDVEPFPFGFPGWVPFAGKLTAPPPPEGPTFTMTLVSHAAGDPRRAASIPPDAESDPVAFPGSTSPTIDADGSLVAFLSEGTDLVPGQHGEPGVNAFLWDRPTDLTLVFSGRDGNFDQTSPGRASLLALGRNSDLQFSGAIEVLTPQPGQAPVRGYGVTYFNNGGVLTDVALSNTVISQGSGPGTSVGSLTARSDFAGQAVLDRIAFTLDPNVLNNSSFAVGGTRGGSADLLTGFTAIPGSAFQVQPRAVLGDSVAVRTFELTVSGSPAVITSPVSTQALGRFDPATATWYLVGSPPFAYGVPGWVPVLGDWDGDGVDTVGAFDPASGLWFLRNSNSAGGVDVPVFAFGAAGWLPVVGDWNGDGTDTVGVFDPASGTFFLRNSNDAGGPDAGQLVFGLAGWRPVAEDWDGDGTTTVGVFDPSAGQWYLRDEEGGVDSFAFGGGGWTPVVGDWDADGDTTVGVVDPTGQWFLRNGNSSGGADLGPFVFGFASWVPLSGQLALPLRLEGGGAPALPSLPATLSEAALGSAVESALDRLVGAGVGPRVVDVLARAEYAVGPLPAGILGLTYPGSERVVLSADAVGRGWFIEPTPGADEEFASGQARAGSAAEGGVDLLSVLLHEMGHLAGLDHDAGGLLGETLAPGERRIGALDLLFSGHPVP